MHTDEPGAHLSKAVRYMPPSAAEREEEEGVKECTVVRTAARTWSISTLCMPQHLFFPRAAKGFLFHGPLTMILPATLTIFATTIPLAKPRELPSGAIVFVQRVGVDFVEDALLHADLEIF